MILDIVELSQFLGVNQNTIYKWLQEGCPVHERGNRGKKRHKFITGDVVKWRIEKTRQHASLNEASLSKDEAQRRKLTADAEMAELELAKKKGEVVDLNELQLELNDKFAFLRSNMRKIPERCVMRIVGETNERKIKDVILEEIDQALEVLSYDADE